MATGLRVSANQSLSLAEAKAHLSSVVSGVQQTRTPVTITRRGVPVATIVPVAEDKVASGYGYMRGTVQVLGDIVGPTGEDWGF